MTSLSIRNFRGISELDLDFSGPDGEPNGLVVLAGPNGCGKTTALEAALIVSGGSDLITGKRGEAAIRRGADTYEITAGFQDSASSWHTKDVPRSHHPPRARKVVPYWYFSSWRVAQLVGPIDATVGQRSRQPARTDQNRLLTIKQRLVNRATTDRFHSSTPGLGNYDAVITQINEAWREFYPDAGHEFAVEVQAQRDEEVVGAYDVFVRSADGTHLPVDLLSAGQLELFLFLSELALNSKQQGIVFIDEPELHLDPQWHRLIMRSLRKLQPRVQLIVATHSPEIYDAAASYERHYLVPENDPRSWLWTQQGTSNSRT
jgi:energy-coupling factor transporter ATP-binding protein EcfA2